LLTLAVLYSLARRLFDRPTAIVTSVLFAISPVAVWYAATARMYAFTELLTVLAIRLLVEAYYTQRPALWLAFGLCAGLALDADLSGAYLIAAGLGWYLVLVVTEQAPLRPMLRSLPAMALLLTPDVFQFLDEEVVHHMGLGQIAWIPAPTPAIVLSTLMDLFSQQVPARILAEVAGCTMAVLALLVCSQDATDKSRRRIYLLLVFMALSPLVLPLLSSFLHPIFLTRQVLTALFGILLLLGRTIVLLWRRWRLPAVATLLLLFCLNTTSLQVMANDQLTEDWAHAVPYLLQHSHGSTLLVFQPWYYDQAFALYAQLPETNLKVEMPPTASPQPGFATTWFIGVDALPHAFQPPTWSGYHLVLVDRHSFHSIVLYHFVPSGSAA
jgi:uncharacterized membrane protein